MEPYIMVSEYIREGDKYFQVMVTGGMPITRELRKEDEDFAYQYARQIYHSSPDIRVLKHWNGDTGKLSIIDRKG